MTRVYYSELLVKNALKAEEIKISVLIPLCYYRELHIQISERFRALLDLKVGVRIGVTFPTVTLGSDALASGVYFCYQRKYVNKISRNLYTRKSHWRSQVLFSEKC